MKLILSIPTIILCLSLATSGVAAEGKCIQGDCINGYGSFMYANGESYVGDFKDGLKHGKGIFYSADGDIYRGEFKDDIPHGYLMRDDRTCIEGDCINGKGILIYKDGSKYEGEFKIGRKHGMGRNTLSNGDWFEGEFKNDKPYNGIIKKTIPIDNFIYEGEFQDGSYKGKGIMYYSDGSKYNGQHVLFKRYGVGRYVSNDGYKILLGYWKDDKLNGYGIITEYGEVTSGIWKENKLVRKNEGTLPPEETYLYSPEEERKADEEGEISGTAFFINLKGDLVTNNHVIANCEKIQIANNRINGTATVVTSDEFNDLAIIKSNKPYTVQAKLRGGTFIRVGEDIITIGYPLGLILGETAKVTTGNISSLTGIANDTSNLQITAPIQPGNSGGPVIDMSGNVVGVVSAKINELAVAEAMGSLPQNINFAIKSFTLQIFLDAHNIDYGLKNSEVELKTADIAEEAQNYTVRVNCSY